MKYTVISVALTASSLAGAKDDLEQIMAETGSNGIAVAANIYIFRTKEAAKQIHYLTGFLMRWGLPFVSIQTEGPVSLGLKEAQYQAVEALGIEVHRLALDK